MKTITTPRDENQILSVAEKDASKEKILGLSFFGKSDKEPIAISEACDCATIINNLCGCK